MPDDPATSAPAPIPCAACGRHGAWDPAKQAVACVACGTTIDPGPIAVGAIESFEFIPLLRDRPDSGRDWRPGATRVRCAACGTPMEYPAYLAGRACEGCGSPTLVPCDATGAPVHPSGVVPFAISEAAAREHAAAWIAGQRPMGSRRHAVIDTVRAVYVPCWTFSARVRVPWRALWQKKDRDGNVEAVPIDGVEELTFDDEVTPASASVPADLLRKVEPVPAAGLRPYDPRYLAGYQVELYAVNLWDAWDPVDADMQRRVDAAVKGASGRNVTDIESWPEWSGQRCRHVLAPVYAVGYTYGGKPFTALVNGHTGTVAGTSPTDWIALAIGSVILMAGLAAVVALAIVLVRWLF